MLSLREGAMSTRWLILDMRRGIWWGANQCGYTDNIGDAGRYTDAEALAIAERMNDGSDNAVQLVPKNVLGHYEIYIANGVKRISL